MSIITRSKSRFRPEIIELKRDPNEVTFHCSKDSLRFWRAVLRHRYVNDLPSKGFSTQWVDYTRPDGGNLQVTEFPYRDCEGLCVDDTVPMELAQSTIRVHQQKTKLLVIHMYYTSCTILIQGKKCMSWVQKEFSRLQDVVHIVAESLASQSQFDITTEWTNASFTNPQLSDSETSGSNTTEVEQLNNPHTANDTTDKTNATAVSHADHQCDATDNISHTDLTSLNLAQEEKDNSATTTVVLSDPTDHTHTADNASYNETNTGSPEETHEIFKQRTRDNAHNNANNNQEENISISGTTISNSNILPDQNDEHTNCGNKTVTKDINSTLNTSAQQRNSTSTDINISNDSEDISPHGNENTTLINSAPDTANHSSASDQQNSSDNGSLSINNNKEITESTPRDQEGKEHDTNDNMTQTILPNYSADDLFALMQQIREEFEDYKVQASRTVCVIQEQHHREIQDLTENIENKNKQIETLHRKVQSLEDKYTHISKSKQVSNTTRCTHTQCTHTTSFSPCSGQNPTTSMDNEKHASILETSSDPTLSSGTMTEPNNTMDAMQNVSDTNDNDNKMGENTTNQTSYNQTKQYLLPFPTIRLPDTCTHLMLGDSNLKNISRRRLDNTGQTQIRTYSGSTINTLTNIISKSGIFPSVKKVAINVGTNDCAAKQPDLHSVNKEYEQLISQVTLHFPIAHVAIIAIPPQKQSKKNKIIKQANSSLKQMCSNLQTHFISLESLWHVNEKHGVFQSQLLADHIHLSGKGLSLFIKEIKPFLAYPPQMRHASYAKALTNGLSSAPSVSVSQQKQKQQQTVGKIPSQMHTTIVNHSAPVKQNTDNKDIKHYKARQTHLQKPQRSLLGKHPSYTASSNRGERENHLILNNNYESQCLENNSCSQQKPADKMNSFPPWLMYPHPMFFPPMFQPPNFQGLRPPFYNPSQSSPSAVFGNPWFASSFA